MRILADKALPNASEVFSQYGEVLLKEGRKIVSSDLKDIDALIIRSVTKVNDELLKEANVLKFIGTATAGTDHIDMEATSKRNIVTVNAPGSNAVSVGDYVLSVLLVLSERFNLDLNKTSIGIVGCGNTGSQVARKAEALGMTVRKNDPIRFKNGDLSCGASFDDALSCDIVTFHVPLQKEGPYKTYHMLDYDRMMALKPNTIIINASRGPVVCNKSLKEALKIRSDLKAWCDVFEGEPEISERDLLPLLCGATPHIAGYSYESKRRASVMLAQSMAQALNLDAPRPYKMPDSELCELSLGNIKSLDLNLLARLVFSVYDVRFDAYRFENLFHDAKSFDYQRVNYRERRELNSLKLKNVPKEYAQCLEDLGFSVI